jgi:hypothetical protein
MSRSIVSQIAEVNQFGIGDLRLGIEEFMIKAGTPVDFRFLIGDLVETRVGNLNHLKYRINLKF